MSNIAIKNTLETAREMMLADRDALNNQIADLTMQRDELDGKINDLSKLIDAPAIEPAAAAPAKKEAAKKEQTAPMPDFTSTDKKPTNEPIELPNEKEAAKIAGKIQKLLMNAGEALKPIQIRKKLGISEDRRIWDVIKAAMANNPHIQIIEGNSPMQRKYSFKTADEAK